MSSCRSIELIRCAHWLKRKLIPPRLASTTWNRIYIRSFCSQKEPTQRGEGCGEDPRPPAKLSDPCQVSLSEPFPGMTRTVYTRWNDDDVQASDDVRSQKTKITTLKNGIRVATEPKFGQFCTLGVCVDSGSRYEVAYPSGVSHFLEKLAFGATDKFASRDEILKSLEKYGGICDCQSTRDTFLYAASIDSRGMETAVEVIGEVVLRPKITEEEIDNTRTAVNFELQDAGMNPSQEVLSAEAIHAAAFSNNTVGLPKLCPKENVATISRPIIFNYLSHYHSPERMVLAGVGVDHDQLVEAAEKYLVNNKPIWHREDVADGSRDNIHVDKSLAQYTGGLVTVEKDLSNASLGPTPFPDLAHVSIGLESVSHQDDDFIAFCVLNMLMGGGGSFSAGGPGKGMYTRLYTHVLNRYHWLYAATAFNHAYADAGVFCVTASAPPEMLGDLCQVLVKEFHRLSVSGDVQAEELERAKKQLKSMLLMNLESRPVIFEDLARQVLAQGRRDTAEHYIQKISGISATDLKRIADRMLASKPAVAAIGNLKNLPNYRDIELGILDKEGKMPGKQKFRLFR